MEKYYMPSNGTEGDSFIAKWCKQCAKDTFERGGKTCCNILNKSMIKPQVRQWQYVEGKPTCISFKAIGVKSFPKTTRKIKGQTTLFA